MDERQSRVPVWAWVFLALLGLAVAFLVFSLLSGDDSEEPSSSPSAAQASTTPAPVPTQANSDPNDSICGLPAGDQSIPEEAPETTWELIDGFAVPTSQAFGPGVRENGQLRCFAHNPTGALFAASRWIPITSGNFETARTFMEDERQVSYSVDSQRSDHIDKMRASFDGDGPTKLQIEGFKIDMIDSDNAVITLALGAPLENGTGYGRLSMPIPLKWENGDWVVQVSTTMSGPEWVDSLVTENFIPWSGVN